MAYLLIGGELQPLQSFDYGVTHKFVYANFVEAYAVAERRVFNLCAVERVDI